MLRASRPLRALALAAAAVLAAVFGSAPASAEEAIVLDNGAVLRGTVVRDDANGLLFRLSGVGGDSRITIPRERVQRRFTTVDPARWTEVARAAQPLLEESPRMPASRPPPRAAETDAAPAAAVLPDEEPESHEETYFSRTARRAALAVPTDPGSRTLLSALALVVLLCLVGLGGKMADLPNLTLARGTSLALLLGAMIAADVLWPRALLRADHAAVVLPLQLFVWTATASTVLRCGYARSFLLLAFVLMSGMLAVFTAGAVLVSV
jgi:hypothetical protein